MSIAIIDYGSGNLCSAAKAFERAADMVGLKAPVKVTSDPDDVKKAHHLVLPGVGAFADCARGLAAVDGMTEALQEAVCQQGKPFFGICVGMQLLASHGLEHGSTDGLDWISGDVVAMTPQETSLKIPHMGWNTIAQTHHHPVLDGIPTGPDGLHAYFVHSFHFLPKDPAHILA
ncbi:MAG: imidazole glycerol phosphate synthase subunit HisH, partial [Cohaesibacter sp.]|nr:imidazole glycerol phosphate synthase subunit HisH [Cohaesibacter sp.]